jgi:hypothetical protein
MPQKKTSKTVGPADLNPGLRVGGSRATERVPLPAGIERNRHFARRIAVRKMSRDYFIEHHSSGTLRKNANVGMHAAKQYLHERIVFEFGWCFECLSETRVTWGQPITEPDCKPVTEVGWHIDRYAQVALFPGDEIETKYVIVDYGDGVRKEGLGLVVRRTSAQFIPEGYMVFAIIAEFDTYSKHWKEAVNPC